MIKTRIRYLTGIFLLLLQISSSFAESSDKVEMRLQKINDSIYFVQGKAGVATDNHGFISNSAFIITSKGIIVFDALGTPALARQYLDLIRQVSNKPVIKVIMSHYHADHLYGLQVFKQLGAVVYAPAGAMDYYTSEAAINRLEERRVSLFPDVDEDTHLVKPDILVKDKLKLNVGGKTLLLQNVGKAHSDGDLTLLLQPDNVLFSGDLIFSGRVPFVGRQGTKHWLQLLQQLNRVKVKAIVPGHGGLAKNPRQTLQLTLRYISYLRQQLSKAIDDLQSFDEAYQSIDWSEFKDLPAFAAANRGNAYRVYLSLEEEGFE